MSERENSNRYRVQQEREIQRLDRLVRPLTVQMRPLYEQMLIPVPVTIDFKRDGIHLRSLWMI